MVQEFLKDYTENSSTSKVKLPTFTVIFFTFKHVKKLIMTFAKMAKGWETA